MDKMIVTTGKLSEGRTATNHRPEAIALSVLWPNDIDHWVKQSPLDDWFSWDYNKGRWVATLAYFNPY